LSKARIEWNRRMARGDPIKLVFDGCPFLVRELEFHVVLLLVVRDA
jgi:hypothetical protein